MRRNQDLIRVACSGIEGAELETRLSELKAAIFETLNSAAAIDAVVARYCRCRIDRLLKKIDFSESSNVAEITAECDRQMISINIADIAQRATDRIQKALQGDDLPTLLANYDNKAMMALAARHLKSSKLADFESWLTRALRNDKVPALITAIRNILPTIQPQ